MRDNDKIIDEVTDILDVNSDNLDQHTGNKNIWDLAEAKQPNNFSWLTLDVHAGPLATDTNYFMTYSSASEMRREFLLWAHTMLTDDLLEYIQDGSLNNLTLRIGPDALSGCNLNEEMGIEHPSATWKRGVAS